MFGASIYRQIKMPKQKSIKYYEIQTWKVKESAQIKVA